MRIRPQRGSALLISIVLVAILAVVGLALVTRTTQGMEGVGAKRQHDSAVQCAEGARAMLLSQFRIFGAAPTSITLNQIVADKRYATGHYDQFNVGTVTAATGAQAANVGVSDITNRTSKAHLGGQVYRMTVVCADTTNSNRQAEVEFLVRFGL